MGKDHNGLSEKTALAGKTTVPCRASVQSCRKIRIWYIVSQPVRWVSFEWLAGGMNREKFEISFLLLGKEPLPLGPYLEACSVEVRYVPYRGRFDVATAAGAITRLCRAHAVDIVHTHFMDACLAGLTGAYFGGVPVRIHTRHHAGPYPISHRPPWGSLYDQWNNRLSTAVIAPSEQAKSSLLDHDGLPPGKVFLIHHGFALDAFRGATEADALRMRIKYGLGDDRPVIGVVARYERIKGVEYVILAFRRLLATYPTARLVLVNARGRRVGAIRRLLETLPASHYTEIPFEEEMPALYMNFDVFVHAPINPRLEAFGQVYVEAMAAGVPNVCTIAGVAQEFVIDGVNAIVVDPQDSDQIHDGIIRILGDPALRMRLSNNASRSVEERFGLERMLCSLEDLYLRLHISRGGHSQ
jgi:glycosyltransferase involved in cell wall biosynthesis